MAKSSLNSKGFLQRIAEALERWANIEIKPCPPLSTEGYYERIAIALEKMFGDGSDDKSNVAIVGQAIVGTSVVGQALVNTAVVDSAIVDTDITG